MDKMKALVIRGAGDVRLEKVPVPVCEEDEVLVRVKASILSVCDVLGALNSFGYSNSILGRNLSGEIIQVGKQVNQFGVGDRVTVAPLSSCGSCQSCLSGRAEDCKSYSHLGSLSEYISVKAENVVRVDEDIDYLSAAMIELTTITMSGIEKLNVQQGATVAIFGAGSIGLLNLQCLRASGAEKIYVIDTSREKLRLAKELGADVVLNSVNEDVLDYMNKNGRPDIIIETAGNAVTRKQSMEIVKKHGKVMFVGKNSDDFKIPSSSFENIITKELEVSGFLMSHGAANDSEKWTEALSNIKDGIIKTSQLISGTFKLEDGVDAIKMLTRRSYFDAKVMFEI